MIHDLLSSSNVGVLVFTPCTKHSIVRRVSARGSLEAHVRPRARTFCARTQDLSARLVDGIAMQMMVSRRMARGEMSRCLEESFRNELANGQE